MEQKEQVVNQVVMVDCGRIAANRAQPRKFFSEEQLASLARSIQENGLLQPLTVRETTEHGLELISGERRLRACELLGYPQVPCLIVEKDDRGGLLLQSHSRHDTRVHGCGHQASGANHLTVHHTVLSVQEKHSAFLVVQDPH